MQKPSVVILYALGTSPWAFWLANRHATLVYGIFQHWCIPVFCWCCWYYHNCCDFFLKVLVLLWKTFVTLEKIGQLKSRLRIISQALLHIVDCVCLRVTHNSTQRASMDAGVKHLSVHIYLVTSVYQVLQSTWFAYWSIADSGQVGRKII